MQEIGFNARGKPVTVRDRRIRVGVSPAGKPVLVPYSRGNFTPDLDTYIKLKEISADAYAIGPSAGIGIENGEARVAAVQFYRLEKP